MLNEKQLRNFNRKINYMGTVTCFVWTRCHEWTGAFKNNVEGHEYGRFNVNGKAMLAHRISKMLDIGYELRPDQLVNHWCGNCKCVRPDHLYIGTFKQNSADMLTHGTRTRSLTEDQVIEIRELIRFGYGPKRIAELLGFPKHMITSAKNGYRDIEIDVPAPNPFLINTSTMNKNYAVGSHNGNSVFDEEIIQKIRSVYATGNFTLQEIADSVGTNKGQISRIVNRKTWRHI